MFKKILFFMSFLVSVFIYAQEPWNFPPNTISAENQDAILARIAINADNKAIAIWNMYNGSNYIIQTNHSQDAGSSWSLNPTNLSQTDSNAHFANITMNSSDAAAIWQGYDGSNYIIQTKSSQDFGSSWSSSIINLSDSGQNSDAPQIAMNNSSKTIAIWRRFNGSNYIIQTKYSTDGGKTYNSNATNLSAIGLDSYNPKVVINDSNQAIAVWSKYDGLHYIIQAKYSQDGGASWNDTAINLSASNQDAADCQIALNNLNEAIAIWTIYDGSNYIVQTKCSQDGGRNWSATATDLSQSGQNALLGEIALNNFSKAIAIWNRFDGNNWIVQIKSSQDGGISWSLNSTDLSLPGRKSWDPNIFLTDSNVAIAVWKRFSEFDWIVQAKDSQDAGISWNASATDLSASGQNAYDPKISINSTNKAIAIWSRFDGTNWKVQTINN